MLKQIPHTFGDKNISFVTCKFKPLCLLSHTKDNLSQIMSLHCQLYAGYDSSEIYSGAKCITRKLYVNTFTPRSPLTHRREQAVSAQLGILTQY